jgi:hypothetical protein
MRPDCRSFPAATEPPGRRRRVAALSAAALLACAGVAAQDGRYESGTEVALDEVLPDTLITSGQHRVTGVWRSAGPRLVFRIESEAGGAQEAVSIPLALVRIQEVQTISQAIDQLQRDTAAAADETRGQIRIGGDSIGDIITSPFSTSAGVVDQFGQNVGQTVQEFGKFPGPDGGGAMDDRPQIGDPIFESRRRSAASQLGLDVYSSNPRVQALLNALARARAGGQTRAGITTVSITRAPEVSVGGGAVQERIRGDVLNAERDNLFQRTAEKLAGAGVGRERIEAFLTQPVLSPSHKAAITEYVVFMDGVGNPDALVSASLGAGDEVEALAKVQLARMFAHFHESVGRLREFIGAGHLALAVSEQGGIVVALPFDVLEWNEDSDRVFSALADFADRKDARSRTLVLTGVVTERALSELAQRAFNVRQRFLFRL